MAVYKDQERNTWYYTGRIKDTSGIYHTYKKRGFGTKKEAKQAENAFLKSKEEDPGSLTLQEVVDIYSQRIDSLAIKETTLYGDLTYYRIHIKDTFGDRKVKDITPNMIEIWLGEQIKKKKIDGGTYSVRTINHAKNVLSKFMTYAKRLGQIQYNPVGAVPSLKDHNPIQTKKDSEENFWELEEFNEFMSYVEDPFWQDVFSFLFQTGLREGEMFGLIWDNVNLVKGTIFIAQSISNKTDKGHYVVTTPKNTRSIRTVILSEQMKETLKRRYQH